MSNKVLATSIVALEDGKLFATLSDGETAYMQPVIVVDSLTEIELVEVRGVDRIKVRVDTSIVSIDGVAFASGSYAQLETALRELAKKANGLINGGVSGGGGGGNVTVVGNTTDYSTGTNQSLQVTKAEETNDLLTEKTEGLYWNLSDIESGVTPVFPFDITEFVFNSLENGGGIENVAVSATLANMDSLVSTWNANMTFASMIKRDETSFYLKSETSPLPSQTGVSDSITMNDGLFTFRVYRGNVSKSAILPLNGFKSNIDQSNELLNEIKENTDPKLSKKSIVRYDSDALNAASSLEVAEGRILGNYVMDFNNIQSLIDRQGTGTQSYADGVNGMIVTSGQYAISQSFQFHPYFAGKTQTAELTFDNFQTQANVVKEVGYYTTSIAAPYNTDYDGFYLESDGTTYNIVIANANTGLKVTIPISSWDNQDISLDFSKFTVMKIDFLYLGGTSVRFFFKTEIGWELAHTYNHANVVAGTICATPVLPVRWSIRSSTGSGAMGQICATVNTSGLKVLVGQSWSTPPQIDPIDATTVGTNYLLYAIRLKDRKKAVLDISQDVLSTTNDNVFVSIVVNGTIANEPLWTEFLDEFGQASGVEYISGDTANPTSNTTVTGGTAIWGGHISSVSRALKDIVELTRKLGFSINGAPIALALVATPLSGGSNSDLRGNLSIKTN